MFSRHRPDRQWPYLFRLAAALGVRPADLLPEPSPLENDP